MFQRNFSLSFQRSATVAAVALALGALTLPATAATSVEPTAPPAAVKSGTEKANMAAPTSVKKVAKAGEDNMQLSREGLQTMHDIRMARIAIFQGDASAAGNLVKDATKSLDAVNRVAVQRTPDLKTDLLAIDGQIVLSDNYVDTPVKREHVAKANEHFTQGRGKAARDELRLAEVDASFSRVMMPLDATRRQLNAASSLIDAKQYYEANLALKAAEDGLLTDTVAISETPEAGTQANQTN